MVLMLFVMLSGWSFYGAAVNVIGAGVAIAIYLVGVSLVFNVDQGGTSRRQVWKLAAALCCFFISWLCHASQIVFIVIIPFCFGQRNCYLAMLLWLSMILLVYFELNPVEKIGDAVNLEAIVNERANQYIASTADYWVGFRWDFVLFQIFTSLLPLYFIVLGNYRSVVYQHCLVTCHFLCCTFFVSSFHVAFSDRVGLTSFFLVPLLAAYPLCDPEYVRKRFDSLCVMGFSLALAVFSFWKCFSSYLT